MSGYSYLASPYSHPDPLVRHARYLAVCRAAGRLMLNGRAIFAPICHSHPIEVKGICRVQSGEFWKHQDLPLLRHAERLIVLTLPGWQESAGIRWEIEEAKRLGINVEFLKPHQDDYAELQSNEERV